MKTRRQAHHSARSHSREAPVSRRRVTRRSVALVRRRHTKPPITALVRRGPQALAAPLLGSGVLDRRPNLTDEVDLGALGLVELKLKPEEEAVLAEPVRVEDVQIKPTGQAYLSHPAYTRWFNRAFGRTGWSLVPAAKAMRSGTSVVCPYVLHVHQLPVAFAIGEQEYFEGNREQTYGDALESTIASGLRRCAKRLGVGLELWDRRWLQQFLATNAVRVQVIVERDGQEKAIRQWRRRDDPPFWNEREAPSSAGQEKSQRTSAPPLRSSGSNRKGTSKISPDQVGRLWTIIRKSGRTDVEVRAWLKANGVEHTRDITQRDYENIVDAIEHPGPLPEAREPGQEG